MYDGHEFKPHLMGPWGQGPTHDMGHGAKSLTSISMLPPPCGKKKNGSWCLDGSWPEPQESWYRANALTCSSIGNGFKTRGSVCSITYLCSATRACPGAWGWLQMTANVPVVEATGGWGDGRDGPRDRQGSVEEITDRGRLINGEFGGSARDVDF